MMNSLPTMRRSACRLVILAISLAVLGAACSKTEPVGTVQGKVLLNESPYTDAAVVFLSPKTGNGGTADIQADGTFRIQTPMKVGSYTVYLAPKVAADGGGDRPVPVRIDRTVPQKYWNEATSDVSIQVNEGKNEVAVRLKK